MHLHLASWWTLSNLFLSNLRCFKIRVNFIFLGHIDHLIYVFGYCVSYCRMTHAESLLLVALEDKPHTWKEVPAGNRISHRVAASLPILAGVPCSKSLAGAVQWGEHTKGESTAKVNSNLHSSGNLQSIWAFLNRSVLNSSLLNQQHRRMPCVFSAGIHPLLGLLSKLVSMTF